MTTTKPVLAILITSLAAVASVGCGDDLRQSEDNLGSIRADLTLAPVDARCAVITITAAGATSTRQLPLGPSQTAVFDLTGLPTGLVTLSEQVFTVACSAVTGAQPTWASDPVTVTLEAGTPVDVTFNLRRVAAGGQVSVTSNFPTPPVVREFSAAAAAVTEIVTGPDDALWFLGADSVSNTPLVGRMTTSGVVTTLFPVPGATGILRGIVAGPDGNLWFAEFNNDKIGRITPSGTVAEFTLAAGRGPSRLAVGPDGRIWFTEFNAGRIAQITLGGTVTEFAIPSGSGSAPIGITTGSDRNLWFVENSANKIGRITTAGVFTEFTIPTAGSAPGGICAGSDGNLWFSEELGNRIGRITTAGSIAEFPIPTAGSFPFALTTGPDGNIWFVEVNGNQIGRLTVSGSGLGTIVELGVPSAAPQLVGITLGSDGGLWFTELAIGQIGTFNP